MNNDVTGRPGRPGPRRLLSELGRASATLAAAVDLRLQREAGLPLALFEVMAVIADRDACRVNDLAAELGISSGGASKLIDRLAARGHCRRRPNPGDRRSSLLELSPAGAALLASAGPIVDAELDQMLGSRFSPAELAQLAATLRELRAAVPDD
jgi:MarR family transcriptional regulator, organic hydroperoxide resistance regulator